MAVSEAAGGSARHCLQPKSHRSLLKEEAPCWRSHARMLAQRHTPGCSLEKSAARLLSPRCLPPVNSPHMLSSRVSLPTLCRPHRRRKCSQKPFLRCAAAAPSPAAARAPSSCVRASLRPCWRSRRGTPVRAGVEWRCQLWSGSGQCMKSSKLVIVGGGGSAGTLCIEFALRD
eukprot:364444-Chlamydomonas_euryale.AAC.21